MAERKSGKSTKSRKSTYKGRTIRIRRSDKAAARRYESVDVDVVTIEIDGRSVEIFQTAPEVFESILMPYKSYASALELARDIIDYEPSFQQR